MLLSFKLSSIQVRQLYIFINYLQLIKSYQNIKQFVGHHLIRSMLERGHGWLFPGVVFRIMLHDAIT